MATDRDFSTMLNEHLSYDLLKADMLERAWLLNFVERDDEWKGGSLIVPFRGAKAANVKFGSLPVAADVQPSQYVRGTVSSYKEVWGTLVFQHTDLIQHDGKVSEASFLKLLPDEIDDFNKTMKERVSCQMLNGFAAKLTADGDASGNVTVDHPERFELGEQIGLDDDNSASTTGYVRSINMDTGVITLYDAASGGSVVNCSGYTTAQNAKLYYLGSQPTTSAGFTSLRDQLLSSTNGGSSTLFGQTKTAYPHLQAINQSGSNFTENNILEGIFNKWVTIRNRCSGNPQNVVMSYKNFAAVLKNLESGKGSYNVVPGSRKTSAYGWDTIEIGGPKGGLKCVAVQEAEDDVIYVLSEKGIKFHSNGFFRKRVAPDGKSYYETRDASNGYNYLVDIMLFGELVVNTPLNHGIIHSINFSLSEA